MMDLKPVVGSSSSSLATLLLCRSVNGEVVCHSTWLRPQGWSFWPSATVCPFKGVKITSRGVNERSESEREKVSENAKSSKSPQNVLQGPWFTVTRPLLSLWFFGLITTWIFFLTHSLTHSLSDPIEVLMPIHYQANLLFLPLFASFSPSSFSSRR